VTPSHDLFNIFRIKITAPDYDEVFEPARHEKLAFVKEAQVPGSKKGSVTGIFQKRTEGVLGLPGIVPISLRDIRARDPNLANPTGRARHTRLCIDDYDSFSGRHLTATHEVVGWNVFGWINDHIIPLESRPLHSENSGFLRLFRFADQQGRFRKTVTVVKRLTPKTTVSKSGREPKSAPSSICYPALIALRVLPITRSREVHAPVTARYIRSC